MNTGHVISAAGHGLLIGWLFFGGTFRSEPLPIESTAVSIVSQEEFREMFAPQSAPDVDVEDVLQPSPPVIDDTQSQAIEPEVETPKEPVVQAPEPAPKVLPDPEPEVVPEPEPQPQEAPEPETEFVDTSRLLKSSPRPVSRPAKRIAPTPVTPENTDVSTDPEPQEEISASEDGDQELKEQEEKAPEATTDRIVTEAEEEPQQELTSSLRPKRRPARPATQQKPSASNVNDALAEALAGQSQPAAPQGNGGPMTAQEVGAFRVAVENCWNVGSLSTLALETIVTLSMTLDPEGRPIGNSFNLVSSQGGNAASARQAYEAARRAIIRCGARGFDLPPEKYNQWKNIELTFNPERMRNK